MVAIAYYHQQTIIFTRRAVVWITPCCGACIQRRQHSIIVCLKGAAADSGSFHNNEIDRKQNESNDATCLLTCIRLPRYNEEMQVCIVTTRSFKLASRIISSSGPIA